MARYTEPGEYGPEHGLLPAGYQRASDADRDQVAEQLRAAFTDGRLTEPEFDARLSAALATVARDALPRLVRDLVTDEPAPTLAGGYDLERVKTVTQPDWPARWAALALFEFSSWTPMLAWRGSWWALWNTTGWPAIPIAGTIASMIIGYVWWLTSL